MPANFTEVFVVPFLQSTSSAGHSLTCCVCTSLTPNLWTATPNCLRVSVESLAVHHPVDSLLSIRYLKKRSFLSISSMNYSLFFFFQTHLDFLFVFIRIYDSKRVLRTVRERHMMNSYQFTRMSDYEGFAAQVIKSAEKIK